MRVPFRSREQRRGRHLLDETATDAHPEVETMPDISDFAADPPEESETSRIFKEAPEESELPTESKSDELDDGHEVLSPDAEGALQINESAHDEHTESLELHMDDLIEVAEDGLASDSPSEVVLGQDVTIQNRAIEEVAVEAEFSVVAPSPADSSTDPSETDTGTASSQRPEEVPAVSARTDARMTGSTVVDGAERERPPLPRVIAVANQKGGVGKTTTAVNLGAGLAELGFRVGHRPGPQGNATTGLGIDARNFEFSMYDVIMKDVQLEDCIEPTSLRNLFVAPATIDLAGARDRAGCRLSVSESSSSARRSSTVVHEDSNYVLIDCPPSRSG